MTTAALTVANVEVISSQLVERRSVEVDPFVRLHLLTDTGRGRHVDLEPDDVVRLAADLLGGLNLRRVLLAAREARNT